MKIKRNQTLFLPRERPPTMASFDETFNSLRHRFEENKQPIPPVTLGAISKNGMVPRSPPFPVSCFVSVLLTRRDQKVLFAT